MQGPWIATRFSLGSCNNPTATFHRNGTLYVLCHDQAFSMYPFHPTPSLPAWRAEHAAPIATLPKPGPRRNAPGNCEDPFIYIDRDDHFHVVAHCVSPSTRAAANCWP